MLFRSADTRADWSEGCDAIVQNCSAAWHDSRHHFTMVYADYFLIEALYRLAGTDVRMWLAGETGAVGAAREG